MISTSEAQPARDRQQLDPTVWVDAHGQYLFRYAMFRVRDPSVAEDLVQSTLLSALQAYQSFEGRGSERTWLTGILKHKIIDHFRRTSRELPVGHVEGESFEHEELFRRTGEWKDHFIAERAPVDWNTNPAELFRQNEFWEAFRKCLAPLPERIANAFTLREVDGHTSEEICEFLGISSNNLWVMLHRARAQLRRCLELTWFQRTLEGSQR